MSHLKRHAFPPPGQGAPSGKHSADLRPPAASKGSVHPLDQNMPLLRRGVEGEQPVEQTRSVMHLTIDKRSTCPCETH
ncbi:hypothetical protein W02_08950 [Nitrospira sp. KM1]|nr:hypothetical protein W02_08950 [Nitrospira sp. KM1]